MNMPRDWWATIVLLSVLLVGAELAARFVLAPIGNHLWAYDSTALSRSFEWYRHLSENEATPTVVVIGDSTGARNFDPESFAESSSIDSVYSLARAGNFPRALQSNTLPLLENGQAPEIVILLQWPGSLRDDPRTDQIEAGAVSSILEARLTGRFMVTDYFHVARLFRARSYLVSYWLRDEDLLQPPQGNGFSPFIPPVGADPANANPIVIPTDSTEFSDKRRQVIRELMAVAEQRDFKLIVIVGPYRSGKKYAVANAHLEWLRTLEAEACENLVVVDAREVDGIGPGDFRDNAHLFINGANRFSSHLGELVADIRETNSGANPNCAK